MYNLFILGSGRSGTSMLTGSLANSGYMLGENAEYLGKNAANPKGFYEDFEVNTINEDILALYLWNFKEKIRRTFFPSYTFYRARWLARIKEDKVINKTTKEIDKRIVKVVSHAPFCYKDPRFSYTLPIWKKFVNDNTRYLVIFREPGKTADSIVRECSELPDLAPLKMNYSISLEVWSCMYSHILNNYEMEIDKSKWKFIHYNQMFEDGFINDLSKFVGAEIDKGFADKKISRSNPINFPINPSITKLYNQLLVLANYHSEC